MSKVAYIEQKLLENMCFMYHQLIKNYHLQRVDLRGDLGALGLVLVLQRPLGALQHVDAILQPLELRLQVTDLMLVLHLRRFQLTNLR